MASKKRFAKLMTQILSGWTAKVAIQLTGRHSGEGTKRSRSFRIVYFFQVKPTLLKVCKDIILGIFLNFYLDLGKGWQKPGNVSEYVNYWASLGRQGQFSPWASQSGLKVKVAVLVKYLGIFLMIVLEKGGKRPGNMSEHVSLIGLKVNKVNFHLG